MTVNQYKIVLEGKMGSHSYGTSTPESDLDTMGIVVPTPSKDYYLGLKTFGNSDTVDIKNATLDAHYFEIRKFVNLCLKNNPNCLPLLYIRPQDYLVSTDLGQVLITNRSLFLSKKVYHTFCGYAAAQQKRMLGTTTGKLGEKRKEIIANYGFDTKFAFHTIRLLLMCKEILNDGKVIVYREHDKDFLLDIRNGKYTIEEIMSMVTSLEADCDAAYTITNLPDHPNYEAINNLVVEVVENYL
jgi:predicted nucleotidyltransferase